MSRKNQINLICEATLCSAALCATSFLLFSNLGFSWADEGCCGMGPRELTQENWPSKILMLMTQGDIGGIVFSFPLQMTPD